MGSLTHIYMRRVQLKTRKMGSKRKHALENHGTTPTRAEVFGDAPKAQAKTK